MKSLYKKILPVLAAFAAIAGCVKESGVEVKNTPAIDSSTLAPATDESGKTRAYAGTQVTATGFNLDKVGRVTIDDVDAAIVEASIQKLVFEIPVLPAETYPQQDNPYPVTLRVYDADCETVVFTYPYFVTVPITDTRVTGFDPAEGTVGTVVTISGRNMDQVTKVIFGETEVANTGFSEQSADAVKVPVPATEQTEPDAQIDITVVWSGGEIKVTTDDKKFLLSIPVFDAYTPSGEPLALDEDIILTGENLDLVTAVKWGEFELAIAEKTEGSITVTVPATIPEQDPAIATSDIVAEYGEGAASVVVAQNVSIDTSPIPLPPPELTNVAPSDQNYTNLYLGKEVTVTGQNLFSIASVTVDGVEADIVSASATELKFNMPTTITGTAAKDVTLKVTDTDGNTDEQTIKVYPFYYTKGLRMGVGSSSSSTYSDDARNNSFLMFDRGEVVSVEQWYTEPVDKYALTVDGATQTVKNPLISSLYTIASTATAEQYYSVEPYVYAASASSGDIDIFNPSGSANRISYHRYPGSDKLPETFGTPIVYMRVLNSDEDIKTAVTTGALSDIMMSDRMASRNTYVRHTTTESSSNWTEGSVILVQYITYEHGLNGSAPTDVGDIFKQGYLYVKDLTLKMGEDGKISKEEGYDWSGYIEFDLYWSNPINE